MLCAQILARQPTARGRFAVTGARRAVVLGHGCAVGRVQVDEDLVGRQERLLHAPVKRQRERTVLPGQIVADEIGVGAEAGRRFQRRRRRGRVQRNGALTYGQLAQLHRLTFGAGGRIQQPGDQAIVAGRDRRRQEELHRHLHQRVLRPRLRGILGQRPAFPAGHAAVVPVQQADEDVACRRRLHPILHEDAQPQLRPRGDVVMGFHAGIAQERQPLTCFRRLHRRADGQPRACLGRVRQGDAHRAHVDQRIGGGGGRGRQDQLSRARHGHAGANPVCVRRQAHRDDQAGRLAAGCLVVGAQQPQRRVVAAGPRAPRRICQPQRDHQIVVTVVIAAPAQADGHRRVGAGDHVRRDPGLIQPHRAEVHADGCGLRLRQGLPRREARRRAVPTVLQVDGVIL